MDKDPAKYEQIDKTIKSKKSEEALSSPLSVRALLFYKLITFF